VEEQAGIGADEEAREAVVGSRDETVDGGGDQAMDARDLFAGRFPAGRRVLDGIGEGAKGAGEAFAHRGKIGGGESRRRQRLAPGPTDAGAIGPPLGREEDAAEMRGEQRPVLMEGAARDKRRRRPGNVEAEFDDDAFGSVCGRAHGGSSGGPWRRVASGHR